MTWVLVAIGVALAGFMTKEAVGSLVRGRRVAQLKLEAPPIRGRYLGGHPSLDRERNVLIGVRGDDVFLIGNGFGHLLLAMWRPPAADISVMSRAEFQETRTELAGPSMSDGDTDFSDGANPGIDFQGTKIALARIDAVCVFNEIAILFSDRATALELKKAIAKPDEPG